MASMQISRCGTYGGHAAIYSEIKDNGKPRVWSTSAGPIPFMDAGLLRHYLASSKKVANAAARTGRRAAVEPHGFDNAYYKAHTAANRSPASLILRGRKGPASHVLHSRQDCATATKLRAANAKM